MVVGQLSYSLRTILMWIVVVVEEIFGLVYTKTIIFTSISLIEIVCMIY